MSGTQHFPSITAEPESFIPDPGRWPRLKATMAVVAVTTTGAGAGWWWTADMLGALVAAVCLVVLTAAVVAVPAVITRLDASDRRHAAADRDRERLALELGILRTRQDTDHATMSVLGQRVEEQHLAMGDCRSERRNNVLDMRRITT